MVGSVLCYREVKEDKKCEVLIGFVSIEVISELVRQKLWYSKG